MTERVVKPLNGSEPSGTKLLLAILAELPPGHDLPKPWITHVADRQLLDGAGAHWFVDDLGVQRLVWLTCGCHQVEATRFVGGFEVERSVHRTL